MFVTRPIDQLRTLLRMRMSPAQAPTGQHYQRFRYQGHVVTQWSDQRHRGKHCCYGDCKSDSRYQERIPGVTFIPFPKPKTSLDKCVTWIRACGRPHYQLNVTKITKDFYICTKHFRDGGPTLDYPDPFPYEGIAYRKQRKPKKTCGSHLKSDRSNLKESKTFKDTCIKDEDTDTETETEKNKCKSGRVFPW